MCAVDVSIIRSKQWLSTIIFLLLHFFTIHYLTPVMHAHACDRGRSAELFDKVIVVGRVEIIDEILQAQLALMSFAALDR